MNFKTIGVYLIPFTLLTAVPVAAATTKKHAKTKTAVSHKATASSPWKVYTSEDLHVKLQVPKSWTAKSGPGMVGFRQKVRNVEGGFGILRSQRPNESIEEAAKMQFKHQGNPGNWTQSTARIGGQRAIKVITTADSAGDKRLVQYYVETPSGNYIIQCLASYNAWSQYNQVFQKMIGSLSFIP
jgi:hypothetical protein